MSHKSITIERTSKYHCWQLLKITCYHSNGRRFSAVWKSNKPRNSNEENAITTLMDRLFKKLNSTYLANINLDKLRSDIVKGFRQLREIDLMSNMHGMLVFKHDIVLVLDSHLSCKINQNNDNATQETEEKDFSQSELQQKLAVVHKNSKVMKFFEGNKCSVCLNNYKEVLDNDFHIVVPSFGHPLCCECADNILVSEKKECPRCRGNITADSFDLMKFNADLEVDSQDQNVFL